MKNNIKKFKPGEVPNGNGLIANITSSNGGNLFVSGLGSTSNCDDSNASDSDNDEIEGTQQLKKEKNNHQQQQQQHNDSLSAAVAAAVAAATS